MAIIVPNLDDRRFQDYVDDAKRYVQQHCPEWTDHNVSDPGVTLIETFAFMVEQLTYRLNRVPDRNYLKFLELIGLRLFPASAAEVPVTFWLSAPQAQPIVVPQGARVQTQRVDREPPVMFETLSELVVNSSELERVMSLGADGDYAVDHTERLAVSGFACFGAMPIPGDKLLIGLTDPVPRNSLALRVRCHIEGVGVDPRNPPLAWEAYCNGEWVSCELESDGTGGLNQPGDIIFHVPEGHDHAIIEGQRAAWIRCRVIEPGVGQPFYSSSPEIDDIIAFVVGGTVDAVHAEVVRDEILGVSEGVAGQVFQLHHTPVAASRHPHVLDVASENGWREWSEVDTFAASGAEDLHFMLDRVAGEVSFGPMVRLEDGSIRQYGAIPTKAAPIRIREYRSGGGSKGNISAGALVSLRSPIPMIARVENRVPAAGGVDAEDLDNAKARGPITLRTLGRAVTVEDYEILARQSAAGIARVRCVPVALDDESGGVRLLVVPAVADDEDGTLPFARLAPSRSLLETVSREIDHRRTIGARVSVEPPLYQGITVVTEVRARMFADPDRVKAEAVAALYSLLHPIHGGVDGTGWGFGRPVHSGEIYAVLQRVPGVEMVEVVQLYAADPVTGVRGPATQRVEIEPNALFYSYGHEVRVLES